MTVHYYLFFKNSRIFFIFITIIVSCYVLFFLHLPQLSFIHENLTLSVISYLILFHFSAIGSCVKDFVMFELGQGLQAEYHDGEQDHEDGDDGDYAGVLAGLGVFKE